MVDPPQKLPNDHVHDAQSRRLAHEVLELLEHGFQIGTIGEIESLAGKLVERFAQGSVCQPAISAASAVLQAADEMKMAELNDPALALAEPDDSRNLVGDRGADASVDVSGDGGDRLRPAPQILPAWQEHRIQEHGAILMARLDTHQIQDPIFSSKPEVKSVQHQNQGSCWQAQTARSRYELSQRSTKTPTQALTSKTVAWGKSFQCASVQQDRLQSSGTRSPRLAALPFLANAPCRFAMAALTTSRPEAINFRSATSGVRVPRMHARELDTV
jgi:hypothetical protein